jgi:hypothetical protein
MKKYTFVEMSETGAAIDVIMTEQEIIDYYFDYWSNQMRKVGKENMISNERCIEDFCAVHWATEIK